MRRVSGCLFVLAALFAGVATAADPKVYKWTDEDGTVHFSAEPPATGAEEVTLDKAPTPPPAPPAAAPVSAETAAETAKKCEDHRYNLRLLEKVGQEVAVKDENGNAVPLSAAERAEQIETARAALKECETLEAAVARGATRPAG